MSSVVSKEDKPILYVDDRIQNLQSFKATFRREFDVYVAESPREALELLKEKLIKVVVSDYKMPEVTGVTFLEEVKEEYPDTVRIMLTGHADLPAVVDSVNRSEIFRFLAKPWNEDDLRKGLNSAIEYYETKQQLVRKNSELAKAYNELDRLVFSTAHDITGPLSNILGLVDIIRSEPDGMEEYLQLIEKTTKKLQFIARDVLSFHRNKRTEIRYNKIHIQGLIDSVLSDYQYLQDIQDLDISINVEQDGEFVTDRTRLTFILNNLISNAIKYQDKGKSENWVKVDFKADATQAILTVEDNGMGIEEEMLPRVFDIYFRASNKSTGAGIGLYIVTEAVEVVQGKLDVSSQKGQGTKFTVTIPNQANSLPNEPIFGVHDEHS